MICSHIARLASNHVRPHAGLCHFQSTNMKCAQKFVAPAGYLGSSFWGCAILVACAWYPKGPRVAAITLLAFLVVALALTLVGTVAKKVTPAFLLQTPSKVPTSLSLSQSSSQSHHTPFHPPAGGEHLSAILHRHDRVFRRPPLHLLLHRLAVSR